MSNRPINKKNVSSSNTQSQNYYTEDDYEKVLIKLPDIIKEAERKSAEVLEPTIVEKREVLAFIKNFIRKKHRKVYGGTAQDECIKSVNKADAIYDEYNFSDVEFYSPNPVPDMVELCNELYKKGYKHVTGSEAQHEETYKVSVNYNIYCDISYAPTRIYNGIQIIPIDGINYAHPHFMWIDFLRMFNNPMTAGWRWDKMYKRMYKLLKNFPPEFCNKNFQIPKTNPVYVNYHQKIKDLIINTDLKESILINGFDTYNYLIRHAANDKNVDKMARTKYGSSNLNDLITNVPFVDLVSIDYKKNVREIYSFLKSVVPDTNKLVLEEYFPLFQFNDYSVIILYDDVPIVRILEATDSCVPYIETKSGLKYVSYQYLLMSLLINKFRTHLEQDKTMYFNYIIAISNLIKARNIFLDENRLTVVDRSVFREFQITCIGKTTSSARLGRLRMLERKKKGKNIMFRYEPESFFKQSAEAQQKFDPTKHFFKNTSGSRIMNNKNLRFKLDDSRNIIENVVEEDDFTTDEGISKESSVDLSSVSSSESSVASVTIE